MSILIFQDDVSIFKIEESLNRLFFS